MNLKTLRSFERFLIGKQKNSFGQDNNEQLLNNLNNIDDIPAYINTHIINYNNNNRLQQPVIDFFNNLFNRNNEYIYNFKNPFIIRQKLVIDKAFEYLYKLRQVIAQINNGSINIDQIKNLLNETLVMGGRKKDKITGGFLGLSTDNPRKTYKYGDDIMYDWLSIAESGKISKAINDFNIYDNIVDNWNILNDLYNRISGKQEQASSSSRTTEIPFKPFFNQNEVKSGTQITINIDLYDIFYKNQFDLYQISDIGYRVKQLKWYFCFLIMFLLDFKKDFPEFSSTGNKYNTLNILPDYYNLIKNHMLEIIPKILPGNNIRDPLVLFREPYNTTIITSRFVEESGNRNVPQIIYDKFECCEDVVLNYMRELNTLNNDDLQLCSEFCCKIMGIQNVDFERLMRSFNRGNQEYISEHIIPTIKKTMTLNKFNRININSKNGNSNIQSTGTTTEEVVANFIKRTNQDPQNTIIFNNIRNISSGIGPQKYIISVDAISSEGKTQQIDNLIREIIKNRGKNTNEIDLIYFASIIDVIDGAVDENRILKAIAKYHQKNDDFTRYLPRNTEIIKAFFSSNINIGFNFRDFNGGLIEGGSVNCMEFNIIAPEQSFIVNRFLGINSILGNSNKSLFINQTDTTTNSDRNSKVSKANVAAWMKSRGTTNIQKICMSFYKTSLDFLKVVYFYAAMRGDFNNILNNLSYNLDVLDFGNMFYMNDINGANIAANFIPGVILEEGSESHNIEEQFRLFLPTNLLHDLFNQRILTPERHITTEKSNISLVTKLGNNMEANIGAFGNSTNTKNTKNIQITKILQQLNRFERYLKNN